MMRAIFSPMAAAFLAALLACGTGCERRNSDAIVTIGDLSLTAAQLGKETETCLSAFLSKKSEKPPKKLMESSRKKDKDEKLRSRAEAKSLAVEINYMLVASHAKGRDVEPTADELKKIEDEYSTSYFGKRGRFGDFAAALPQEDFKVIRDQVRKIAVVNAFADRHYAEKYRVSEEEVSNVWSHVVMQNKLADATNACIRATALDLVRRARAGEDFAQLADEYSQDEDKEPGGVLPGLHKDDYAYDKPGVWAAISALKPGEVTEPLDSEDGLAIFKLSSMTNCQCSGEETSEEKDYHLQRIIFHRALKPSYESADDVRVELKAQKKRQMWRQIVTDLTAENPLSFPQGFDRFSSDALLMLRAYSSDVPKPKLNKMEKMIFEAMKARQRKHAKERK